MDDSTEANGSQTSVLPPATPSGHRPGAWDGPVETMLPPPAGRPTFRERFMELDASTTSEAPVEAGSVPGGAMAAPGEAMPAPGETTPALDDVQRGPGAEGEPEAGALQPTDPDLGHVTRLLAELVTDLQERGEAALDIGDGLPSFQVTLRAYCRGYLDGRRGAREG